MCLFNTQFHGLKIPSQNIEKPSRCFENEKTTIIYWEYGPFTYCPFLGRHLIKIWNVKDGERDDYLFGLSFYENLCTYQLKSHRGLSTCPSNYWFLYYNIHCKQDLVIYTNKCNWLIKCSQWSSGMEACAHIIKRRFESLIYFLKLIS